MPELFPALDLRCGRAVRLWQGNYEKEKVYSSDPPGIAREFALAGARFLHLVDLEGARSGKFSEEKVLRAILPLPLKVQVGGGIRNLATISRLFKLGVYRVVLGTMVLEEFPSFAEITHKFPGRIVVSLDLKGKEIAMRGWQIQSSLTLDELWERLRGIPLAALLVTAIERDGTLAGPDFPLYEHLLKVSPFPILASGGVGTLEDLRRFHNLAQEPGGWKLEGVIVGRALYEKRFTLPEALAALKGGEEKARGVPA